MKFAPLILAVLATASQAEFVTGNVLSRWLSEDRFVPIAHGYIVGAADAYQGSGHCRPGNVTATQVVEIVKKNLQAYPERLHFSGDSIVAESLNQLWPCPERRSRGERSL